MKKLLLSIFACVASVAAMSAEEVKFDFTTNSYGQLVAGSNTEDNYMEDGSSFSEGVVNVTANKLGGSGVRFWKTDAGAQTFRCNNKSGITVSVNGGTITKIVFTGSSYDYFKVDGTNISSGTWEGSASSVSFVNLGTVDGNGKTKTGTIQMKTMTVTYTGGTADNRQDAGLSFSSEKVYAILGEAFTEPTLTKATTAAVSYASDNEKVATVDAATGKVTLVAAGSARITATAPANDDYKAGSASYLLFVAKPDPENTVYKSENGADFTLANPEDLAVWSVDTKNGYLKGSAYKGDVKAATAYAYVAVDLTGKKDAALIFDNAFNQYRLNDVMIAPADFHGYAYIVAREQGAAEWTTVQEMAAPAAFSWDFYTVGPVSLSAYNGKKVELGFKYVSTAEVAGTWEVKNIFVTALSESAIEDIEAADAPAEYYNLQGIRVDNPASGLYIKRQGNKVSK
ncbi:MAG: Ig-like domain-containing protein, partial [Duncaniella sp.]|nr:Ig-like domain-containing protein [Duncaniella sp.]